MTWILILIMIIILFLLFLAIKLSQGKKHKTDYKGLFVIGIIWLPFGIIFNNYALLIISIIFITLGLINKDKWKSRKEILSNMTEHEKKLRFWIIGILTLILIAGIIVFSTFYNQNISINNFEECITAGYPAMESYPRQCNDGENTWTEKIGLTPEECIGYRGEVINIVGEEFPYCNKNQINLGSVEGLMCDCICCINITSKNNCLDYGELTNEYFYNNNSETLWIELTPFEKQEGCNPACVIDKNLNTKINWRCTGLIK